MNPQKIKAELLGGPQDGMTLRDYFAARAMHAAYFLHMDGTRKVTSDALDLANEAYAVADAMLERRSSHEP